MPKGISAKHILRQLEKYAEENGLIYAIEVPLIDEEGERRMDFFTLSPWRSQNYPTDGYEIKISKADFKRDNKEKQKKALAFCNRFWYVAPKGMLDKSDIPEWAGLKEVCARRMTVAVKAPESPTKAEPTYRFLVALIRNSAVVRRDTAAIREGLNEARRYIRHLEEQLKNMKHFLSLARRQSTLTPLDCQAVPLEGGKGKTDVN